MSKKGFVPIVVLFIIAFAGLTMFAYSKNTSKNKPLPSPSTIASESLIPSPTPKASTQAKKTATPTPKSTTTPTPSANTTVPSSTPFPSIGPFTSIFSPSPSPTTSGYLISVSSTNIVTTISRAGSPAGTLAYGSGFTITNNGATGFQIKYNEPTQGKGFYLSSGGLQPNASINIPTYINTNNSNGTYTGSAIVQYSNGSTWLNGPTVNYTIQLTD